MSARIYVPRETAAISVGADDVALAIARQAKETGASIELIRNGSWGATWLEPLVEVVVDDKRIAYGNVEPADIAGMFEAGLLTGGEHARRIGPVDEIPYLIKQDRWTFWRCGLINPLSIDDFSAHQGFKAIGKAIEMGPQAVIDAITDYYETTNANVHRGSYELAVRATAALEGARAKVASFARSNS